MIGFLYGQTEYNILKNSIHLDDYVTKASSFGYEVLSITDNNLYGHYKFYNLCIKNNIKPLIGLEIKLTFSNQIILAYAMNDLGYKNLCNISSHMMIDKDLTISDLKKYQEGIYFITASNITLADYKELKNDLDNLGVGVSYDEYKLYDMAIENNIKVFPLSLSLYENDNDKIVYDTLCKIGGTTPLEGDYSYKNKEQIKELFKDMPNVFDGLEYLVNSCNVDLSKKRVGLPKYPMTSGKDSKEYLRSLCFAGLKKRLRDYKGDIKIYVDRLNYELSIIDNMGYNDYFLIVWDFIKYAKNNKILVGPGRGSAAGSLVAYSIGISAVDPIKYKLFFERFLNPERISMPDIDTDFPDNKRDKMIEYVKNLYGENHVCNIGTFGTFKIKSSIRDLGRVLDMDSADIDSISHQIQELLTDDNNTQAVLNDLIERIDDSKIKEFLYIASKMEGLPRHISTHAAGIILSDQSLYDIIPLQNGINNMLQTQLEAPDCEALGLLKMDFLGIKNLTIIDNIISNIDGLNNINVFNVIPLDDKKTFDLLCKGDTLGVFQLEKRGMINTIIKLQPQRFEDIVAVLALYRPGPMDNIEVFIKRRHGEKFEYTHPDLAPILEETYGIIVYQEQIMQIAQKFAGYSLGQADLLRRAVSKKKEEVLISERDRFVESSIKNGYSKDIANTIYDDIVKFANYGFNKSHSLVYALFSYTMAYLKANYKDLFVTNILTNVIGSVADTEAYVKYAISNGIKVLPPSVNKSMSYYINDSGFIYMPFNAIKGLGKSITESIILEREKGLFKDFNDFKIRCNLSEGIIEALAYAGAFDEFKITRKSAVESNSSSSSVVDSFLDNRIKKLDEFQDDILMAKEKEVLGFNLIYSKFKDVDRLIKKYKTIPLKEIKNGMQQKFIGLFSDTKELTTKNGEKMLVGSLYDGTTEVRIVIFPKEYEIIKPSFKRGILCLIDGSVREDRDRGLQIVVNKIEKMA